MGLLNGNMLFQNTSVGIFHAFHVIVVGMDAAVGKGGQCSQMFIHLQYAGSQGQGRHPGEFGGNARFACHADYIHHPYGVNQINGHQVF